MREQQNAVQPQAQKNRINPHIVVGILAHVDAGKTTLAESMLYLTGSIRSLGRVDHKNAFLDTFELEKQRGITIFSKQAQMTLSDGQRKLEVTLMDTPGHVDFSAEMERTLQILDYAILVINGTDGVQGHVPTLWKLLKRYKVPVFVFVNKMDLPGRYPETVYPEKIYSEKIYSEKVYSEKTYSREINPGEVHPKTGYQGEFLGEFLGECPKTEYNGTEDPGECPEAEYGGTGYRGEDTKAEYGGTARRRALMEELSERLSERCVNFGGGRGESIQERTGKLSEVQMAEFLEQVALCDDALTDSYLENGTLSLAEIRQAVKDRKVFPCYFGSALKLAGVEEFLGGLLTFMEEKTYPAEFAARVFKIARDAAGSRLTYLKVTGGTLAVKELLDGEKADQLRMYSGGQFQTVKEVMAGEICAVAGPEKTYAGQGLGAEQAWETPLLSPVLTYRIPLPEGCDVHKAYRQLAVLEEEEPQLHLVWEPQTGEIHAQVMGEIQMEILKSMIKERLKLDVSFGAGSIVYKETIAEETEGVGHFEPLRHYAEVHLLLSPGERGSGLVFGTEVSEDELDKNWQRLILTHLEEKEHRGVLTGAPITDMKITLAAGRAHKKHTEGGDFREATYRAVRQGLRGAKNILLEPIYEFRLEVPKETLGRAMSDIERMHGVCTPPELNDRSAVLTGRVPVATMQSYAAEVAAYTKGEGRISYSPAGYEVCHNAEEVIAAAAYDSEADLENPTGSVFCAHGAGFLVEWDRVPDFMHLESCQKRKNRGMERRGEHTEETASGQKASGGGIGSSFTSGRGIGGSSANGSGISGRFVGDSGIAIGGSSASGGGINGSSASGRGIGGSSAEDKELAEIFNRTYGNGGRTERDLFEPAPVLHRETERRVEIRPAERVEEYLLVDGYNIIFGWDDLNAMAKESLDAARQRLMDILCNYQGFKKCTLILVFDAYKVEGFPGEVQKYNNIYVVYTKEAETADRYIERTVREIAKKYHVTVATSDAVEQVIIWGAGALRMSAAELREQIKETNREIRSLIEKIGKTGSVGMLQGVSPELAGFLEEIRLGKRKLEE